MKKALLFLLLLVSVIAVSAQGKPMWSITHNKKKIFSANEENEQRNIITLKPADFKSRKNFTISYSETNTGRNKKAWKRIFGIYDEADKELIRKTTDILKIDDGHLKNMLAENKTVKVYTWSLPKDPEEAARVRVRRVHLCTISLQE